MSENPCEFEKFCMPEENVQCADREDPEDCETYEMFVRVRDAIIEDVRVKLMKWGMPRDIAERTVAALKKQPSQEGE